MAKRKKSKYKKIYIEEWKCRGCEFHWTYKTVRCPMCSASAMIKTI